MPYSKKWAELTEEQREARRAKARAWRAANLEHCRAYRRDYRKRDLERARAQGIACQQKLMSLPENRAKKAARHKAWYQANLQYIRAWHRAYKRRKKAEQLAQAQQPSSQT